MRNLFSKKPLAGMRHLLYFQLPRNNFFSSMVSDLALNGLGVFLSKGSLAQGEINPQDIKVVFIFPSFSFHLRGQNQPTAICRTFPEGAVDVVGNPSLIAFDTLLRGGLALASQKPFANRIRRLTQGLPRTCLPETLR